MRKTFSSFGSFSSTAAFNPSVSSIFLPVIVISHDAQPLCCVFDTRSIMLYYIIINKKGNEFLIILCIFYIMLCILLFLLNLYNHTYFFLSASSSICKYVSSNLSFVRLNFICIFCENTSCFHILFYLIFRRKLHICLHNTSFEVFLLSDQVKVFNDEYQIRLGDKAFFCDHGDELVKQLKATVKQYAVTNGTTVAQERKLRFSGLDQLLDGVFISEQVGVDKPQKDFFDAVWNEIGSYAPDEVVIVGDSLTSDIRGGKNAGILTCWYNPDHLPNKIEVTPDCTIDNLQDILSYLDESR